MRSNTIKNYFHFLLRGSVESFHHKTFLATLGIPASAPASPGKPLHYGTLRGTRQTFILETKKSIFVEVLGLHVRFRGILTFGNMYLT